MSSSITCKYFWFAKAFCHFFRRSPCLGLNCLEDLQVDHLGFHRLKRNHLALQVRVITRGANANSAVASGETNGALNKWGVFVAVDKLFQYSISNIDSHADRVSVFPLIKLYQVHAYQITYKSFLFCRGKQDLRAHVGRVDPHLFVFVNVYSIVVYVVCKEDVWETCPVAGVKHHGPELTLVHVTSFHIFNPLIRNTNAKRKTL